MLPEDAYFSLTGKKAVVLGIARQGKALAQWLPSQGADVVLSDIRDMGELADDLLAFIGNPKIRFALGGHPIELLEDTDLICVSGGVPLNIPIIQEAVRQGVRVTNDATLFIERCAAPIVGITGSAGKTTTTSLVGLMAKKAGHTAWVGGNIGEVLLKDLPNIQASDLVVMELSSFQLELADVSPPIAVVLNVTPNHLDRHGSMEAYANAKAQIFRHQHDNDILIYGHDDPVARAMASEAPANVAAFSIYELVADGACMVGDRLVLTGNCSPDTNSRVICQVEDIQLRGTHNIQNVLAACAVAGVLGIHPEIMRETIRAFRGVPHRLEPISNFKGATWVNDSIATSPERVIAAIQSFPDQTIILLLGGRDKQLPWDKLAQLVVQRCKGVICFGEHGAQIAKHIHQAKQSTGNAVITQIEIVDDLPMAVRHASRLVHVGDTVLLSPGCTSYDAYKDFEERGIHFKDLVERLNRRI